MGSESVLWPLLASLPRRLLLFVVEAAAAAAAFFGGGLLAVVFVFCILFTAMVPTLWSGLLGVYPPILVWGELVRDAAGDAFLLSSEVLAVAACGTALFDALAEATV